MKNKDDLKELLDSYQITDVLSTALKLGLFETIEEHSPTTQTLIEVLEIANPEIFGQFLTVLKNLKLITNFEEHWSNMPLIRDNLSELRSLLEIYQIESSRWNELSEYLSDPVLDPKGYSSFNKESISKDEIMKYLPNTIQEEDILIVNKLLLNEVPPYNYSVIAFDQCLHQLDAGTLLSVLKDGITKNNEIGYIVIIDFLTENQSGKNALSNLSILLSGEKLLNKKELDQVIQVLNLNRTEPIFLDNGLSLIFLSKDKDGLDAIALTEEEQLRSRLLSLGFDDIVPIDPKEVVTAPFTQYLCDYGCRSGSDPQYQKKCAHHNRTDHSRTRELLDSYSKAFLLCGEPPTGTFQKKILLAQSEAFKSGYYKAFTYWAGPCSICTNCEETVICLSPQSRRPSMEGAGIDVFETVKKAGKPLKTLRHKGEYIHYFGLLLLE